MNQPITDEAFLTQVNNLERFRHPLAIREIKRVMAVQLLLLKPDEGLNPEVEEELDSQIAALKQRIEASSN